MAQLPGDFLIYNGVKLQIVTTESFNQSPIMTPDGTDYLYTKIHGAWQCIFNPGLQGILPSDAIPLIRPYLNTPRGQLIFGFNFINGFSVNIVSNLVVSPPDGSTIDLNNGPIPGDIKIHKIVGDQTIHVRFEVTTCIREDGCQDSYILSSRYSQTHTMDKDFYTTIRTSGTTFFNTQSLTDSGLLMDDFRRFIFPLIPYNFKRLIDSVEVDSNKSIMRWSISDIEQGKNIGETGSDGSGTYITDIQGQFHVETANLPGADGNTMTMGLCALSVVSISITGSRLASSWVLIQYAFGLALSQLPIGIPFGVADAKGVTGSCCRSISVTKDIIRNSIELRIAAITPPTKDSNLILVTDQGLRNDNIFADIIDDDGRNPSPQVDGGTRGTTTYQAVEAALAQYCNTDPQEISCSGGLESGQYGGCDQPPVVQPFDFLPANEMLVTESETENPYVYYYLDTTYDSSTGIVNIPSAGPLNNSQNDSLHGGAPDWTTPPSELAQPSQNRSGRITNWGASRFGEPPTVPTPKSGQWQPGSPSPFIIPFIGGSNQSPDKGISQPGNWVPKRVKTTYNNVELLPDGQTLLYTMSGTIEEVCILNQEDSGLVPFPVPPWIDLQVGGVDNAGNDMGTTVADLNDGGGIMDVDPNEQA